MVVTGTKTSIFACCLEAPAALEARGLLCLARRHGCQQDVDTLSSEGKMHVSGEDGGHT